MGKTIYSLVLDDELVRRIDVLANRSGKSRSYVINDILAKHVSYDTPEALSQNMLCMINNCLSAYDDFGIMLRETSMLVRSALSYKYNPTVKYSLDMSRGQKSTLLKVTVRSRSADFTEIFEAFISSWYAVETAYGKNIECSYCEGRYMRRLLLPDGENADTLANAIAGYIRLFDGALKHFFKALPLYGLQEAQAAVALMYRDYVTAKDTIIL